MNAINPDLLKRLQETLLNCGLFESDRELKAIFVDSRIAPWANELPHATTTYERVNATIAYLSQNTRQDTGENGLVLLLQVLRDQTYPEDKRHHDLAQLAKELATTKTATPPPFVAKQRGILQLPNFTIHTTAKIVIFVIVLVIFIIFGLSFALELTKNRLLSMLNPTPSVCAVTVQDFTFSPKVVRVNGTVQVTVNIDNPNGTGVKYNWSVTDGKVNPELNAIQPNTVYTAPDYPGNQTITVKVLPIGCKVIEERVQIVVGNNDSPITPLTDTPEIFITPTATWVATSVNTSEPLPTLNTPTQTPIANTPTDVTKTTTSTPITTNTTGRLAISLKLGFDARIYLTAFDGKGLNGKQPNTIPNAKHPMWSRDGNSIMVNAQVEGIDGLFRFNAIGFGPEIIIERGSAYWPVFSPDGTDIIFSEETLQDALFRHQANGNITPVTFNTHPIAAKYLLWSEDNILVFQGCNTWEKDHEGECGIWATSASNLNPQRIIEGTDNFPMDAKSGKLAFMNSTDGDWDVYIMPLTGPQSQAINLTNNTAQDGTPAISPDGKLVAYISNESGSWAVWTVTVEGTNKKKWFDINSERGTVDVQTWVDDRMSWSR